MRAILVDDEVSNLENLQGLLEKHCPVVKVVATATDIMAAANLIRLHEPNLLFLDIQMGSNSGFDLLNMLPERSFEVIFVTAYDKYGIQAVKFAALDYLLKPIEVEELIIAVGKAKDKVGSRWQDEQLGFLLQQMKKTGNAIPKIALPQQHEIRYLVIDDIVRCEADNTYTFFFLENKDKLVVSRPLKEYSDLLKPQGFLRIHQSHLINPKFVKSWLKEDGGILLMKNGDKVPVSKPNRDSVKAALEKY